MLFLHSYILFKFHHQTAGEDYGHSSVRQMADFSIEILAALGIPLNYLFSHLFSIAGLPWEQ